MMPNLAEVPLAKPEERRAIELGVPADPIIGVRMQRLPVLVAPDFFRLVLPLDVHRPRIPVVCFPRHVVAPLEEENLLAGRRQPVCEGAAAGTGTDDDDVIVGCRHGGRLAKARYRCCLVPLAGPFTSPGGSGREQTGADGS